MHSTLSLILLQQRLSPFVIAAVVLVLLLAIGLLVYFSRRVKKTEKEAEENWNLSMHSIFVDAKPRAQEGGPDMESEAAGSEVASEPRAGGRETRELSAEAFLGEAEAPREFAQKYEPEPEIIEPPAGAKEPQRETLPLNQIEQRGVAESEPAPEVREPVSYTETRPLIEEPVVEEVKVFDDEVWANLEAKNRRAAKETQLLASEPHAEVEPPVREQTAELSEARFAEEETGEARVSGPSGRERFEPPRIDHIGRRERFEPPRIEPLTPREQSDFVERRSQTRALGSERFDAVPSQTDEPAPMTTRAADFAARPARDARVGRKKVAGSVLDIASDAPVGPLVLGEPVRPAEEAGIGGLSRYGKAPDEKAGRAGTIALLLIVLLVAGAVGAYYGIPSFKGWVDKQMAYYSGRQAEEERRAALEPKASVLPNKNETVKETNKEVGSGSVQNISGNALENIEVELSLQREANAPPELVMAPVTPTQLAPGEAGTYRFEFDRDPKYPASYKISRVISNGTEIKFRYPGQNQQ